MKPKILGYILAAALFCVLIISAQMSKADELIMMHSPSCPYCQKFMEEAAFDFMHGDGLDGPINNAYPDLPLTIFDLSEGIDDPNYEWMKKAVQEGRHTVRLQVTPTFILWIGDRETGSTQGHWLGYGGPEHFYSNLDKVYQKAKSVE